MDVGGNTSILCEQGDMGLFGDHLSESDQQKYNEQCTAEENKKDE